MAKKVSIITINYNGKDDTVGPNRVVRSVRNLSL